MTAATSGKKRKSSALLEEPSSRVLTEYQQKCARLRKNNVPLITALSILQNEYASSPIDLMPKKDIPPKK